MSKSLGISRAEFSGFFSVARNMVQVASDHNGCAVLEKGLSYGEERQYVDLAWDWMCENHLDPMI